MKTLSSCISVVAALHVAGPVVAVPASTAAAQAVRGEGSPEPVAATDRFELRSDPRVGLLHFLIDWASADAGEWPPYAPPIREREGWRDALGPDDVRVWADAAAAFDATRGRSFVFDDGIVALRDWAAGVGSRQAIPAADRAIADALEAALPVYERHWWSAHDRRNRAWIEALAPDLDDIEAAVTPRLAAAYGGSWPGGAVPVDVVYYANPVGAYSTGGRLTISSVDRDNQMPQALEMVLHEASHTEPLEGPLIDAVDAAFGAADGEAPDRFWHDLIFFTTGEIVRIVFEETGRPAYRHYGETSGVYTRAERWATELPALERHWRPFVRSGSSDPGARQAALEAMARELTTGR